MSVPVIDLEPNQSASKALLLNKHLAGVNGPAPKPGFQMSSFMGAAPSSSEQPANKTQEQASETSQDLFIGFQASATVKKCMKSSVA